MPAILFSSFPPSLRMSGEGSTELRAQAEWGMMRSGMVECCGWGSDETGMQEFVGNSLGKETRKLYWVLIMAALKSSKESGT